MNGYLVPLFHLMFDLKIKQYLKSVLSVPHTFTYTSQDDVMPRVTKPFENYKVLQALRIFLND